MLMRAIIFDGHCHVCSLGVRIMLRHRIDPPYALIPMQSDRGRALLKQFGIDIDDPTTFLVLDGELVLTQSDGVIHIMRAIGGFWRVIALGRVLPKFWRDWMYDVLARNRYKWFGRREVCYAPPVK
jgi:predicted DCC family thiol-disulfide oxidoreductase YuxK